MLYSWMDSLRKRVIDLLDSGDSAFLQAIERWRAIERDIHDEPENEPEFLVTQVSFLIFIFLAYARLQSGKEIDTDEVMDLGVIASKFYEILETDDEKIVPYLEILKIAIASEPCTNSAAFSTIFTVIAQDHDMNVDTLLKMEPGFDVFSSLYQSLFSNPSKHASGEHYTPVTLCQLMLEHLPITAETTILDPTCGAGAFIVTAINHVKSIFHPPGTTWLKNFHGEDINPVVIIAARVNAWIQTRDLDAPITLFFDTIRISDILDHVDDAFDIIVGNPPWITLKDFTTADRQKQALTLAKELRIAPDAHGVPQLELATIVFAKCFRDKLAPGGQIFLIMTSSFIDGKHCSKFRAFMGIDSAGIWLFEGEPVFPRKYACLLARKGSACGSYFESHSTIPITTWHVTSEGSAPKREFMFSELDKSKYKPVNYAILSSLKTRDGILDVEKFIPIEAAKTLLSTDSSSSHYKALCYNGATIFPQSLLFVDIMEEHDSGDDDVVTIRPAFGLNMKKPWNVHVYESTRIEKRYIFSVVKGSELYPFGIQDPNRVFLPLKTNEGSFSFDGDRIEPGSHISLSKPALASSHFARINKYYKENCKKADRITDLWARINFDNELTNPAMCKPFKVVIPDCGSTMAAAIVKGPCIVEHALHYIGFDDETEAYYLLGVLNAPCIEKDVLLRKAERHLGQLLLDYPIPRFEAANQDHQSIANLARTLESNVRSLVAAAEIKVRTINAEKYQCKACLSFVKEAAMQSHANVCKRLQPFTSKTGKLKPTEWFVKVNDNSNGEVRVKFTRDVLKKKIIADDHFQQLLSELDLLVLGLLGVRDG